MEFRVLGPLEVRVEGQPIALGGAKQRAVLAVLLLRPNEVISVERLIDEVWGELSPPSASHSLEAYISRIRQLLNGHGPTLTRRGAGYCLELGGAVLDADTFTRLLGDASEAVDAGDLEGASALATEALALWYGPALADVSLASAGRAEAERLEEHRLRAFELRSDAELGLGRHESIVGELQVLVGQSPYRERFVAQLMLALYRAGRQAEALEVYERTRAALDDDLGLQPSSELQQLSGQVVRQEPQLGRPVRPLEHAAGRVVREKARRLSGLLFAGAGTILAMAFTSGASAPAGATAAPIVAEPTSSRVALVLPSAPEASWDNPRIANTFNAFRGSTSSWGFETDLLVADEIDPSADQLERVARRIETGDFDLVLVLGAGATARSIAPLVRELEETRFVFLDASLSNLALEGVPNAGAVHFAEEQSSHLAGYLSGLVAPLGARPKARADTVSVVAGPPTATSRRIAKGFTRGVKRALPEVAVRIDYVTALDRTRCERAANRQIDQGSDVVFAIAGECGLGALAVARTRGVWGIGEEELGVPEGEYILATTYKEWERAVADVLNDLGLETFHPGDVALGLEDDYAVGLFRVNYLVSGGIWSKVVHRCSELRATAEANDS